MFKILMSIISILILSSCAPRLMTSDKDSVSFIVKTGKLNNNVDDAQTAAQEHCSKYGKDATLRNINPVNKVQTVAVFNCVEK